MRPQRRVLDLVTEPLNGTPTPVTPLRPEFPDEYLAALDRETGDASASKPRALIVREDVDIESLPPLQWLAAGVIPQSSIAVIYGAPGAGKSFVAAALALSVVTGATWLGRDVAQGGALYCAAEGLAGLGQRLHAWKAAHGLAGRSTGLGFVTGALNLLEPGAAQLVIDAAATRTAVSGTAQLIVFDTLAQSMVGDENDTKDMSLLVRVAGTIRDATGATILLVHHTKKDSDVERGSSTLRGGADTLILCQEADDGRQLVCQKQKDAEAFAPISFTLVAGHGSCVADSIGDDSLAGPAGPGGRMTTQRWKAIKALHDAFTARGATKSEWIRATDMPERTFYHVSAWLLREGYAVENGNRITITPSGRFAAQSGPAKSTATALQTPVQSPSGNPLKGVSGVAPLQRNGNGAAKPSDEPYWNDLLSEADERIGIQEDE